MIELRCKNNKCGKLLAKIDIPMVTTDETIELEYTTNKIKKVEVKCSRCKTMNVFTF